MDTKTILITNICYKIHCAKLNGENSISYKVPSFAHKAEIVYNLSLIGYNASCNNSTIFVKW